MAGATGFSLVLRRGDSEIGGRVVGGFRGVVPREGLGVGPLDRTPVTLIGVRLVRLKKRVSTSSRVSLVSRVPYSPSTNSSQAFLVSGCQILLWFNSGGGIVKPYQSRAVLEPPQRRSPAARGFVEMPRIPPKQRQGSSKGWLRGRKDKIGRAHV